MKKLITKEIMSELQNIPTLDLLKELVHRLKNNEISFKPIMEKPLEDELNGCHGDIRRGFKIQSNPFLNDKIYYPKGFDRILIDSDKLYKIWYKESIPSDPADTSTTLWIKYLEEESEEIALLELIRNFLKYKK
jgi:hypothetical protein